MFSKIKNRWMAISLKRKLRTFSIMVAMVMGMSIAINMLVLDFSMDSLNVILNDNSICYEVQEAIEREVTAFQEYMINRNWENAKEYRLACAQSEDRINALPFDYRSMSEERYARTWNIKNGYEGYKVYRDQVFQMRPEGREYVDRLYRVYRMQEYLQTYARRLMQASLREGKESYQENVPVLYRLPYLIMICSIFMVVTAVCLARFLSNTLISPLVKLAGASREIARNDFDGEDIEVSNQDEMGELVRAFNRMKHATKGYINTLKEKNEIAERLHKEEVERIEMEKRLDAARLELLKSQINPHFLFNTLNMISCTAKLEDAQTTERMISSLGNLFRYNLKTSEQEVALERELKIVRDYMYIQQMRFGSRIQYDSEIRVDGARTLIPAFTLQPLVENAVIHGISKKEEGGRIFLRIWRQGERMIVSVADTGLGMTQEALEGLLTAMKGHRTAKIGIGLGNIYKRVHSRSPKRNPKKSLRRKALLRRQRQRQQH